ncbi:hypothetical protein [Moorena sp. SIO3B2]|uniref:hypothetical protein n=1 Tax=Moorena sp. SIO3B2 TaxID=2607827 RepID=UPI0013C8143F|nr:hypothetical protein [Moorena sp. SIO3B2]NEP32265.1 hypothetical protein [Moorena sp. SIO3B2]
MPEKVSSFWRGLFGVVKTHGGILSGEGFKVKKGRTGTYEITFDKEFAQIPGVTCTIYGDSWKSYQMSISVVDIQDYYFVCETSTPDSLADSAFSFIAVG